MAAAPFVTGPNNAAGRLNRLDGRVAVVREYRRGEAMGEQADWIREDGQMNDWLSKTGAYDGYEQPDDDEPGTCTGCGKRTDALHDGRCADCIASDTGPSADRMHDNRDRLWMENEMRRDADVNRRGEGR